MSVQKICGSFWTWKTLPDVPQMMDNGDGKMVECVSKQGYIDDLKEEFLGNKNYDQDVVKKFVAKMSAKLPVIDTAAAA
jgi:hypothetical protein